MLGRGDGPHAHAMAVARGARGVIIFGNVVLRTGMDLDFLGFITRFLCVGVTVQN